MPDPQRPSALAHPAFDAVADFRKYVILTDDFVAGDVVGDDTATGLGRLGWLVTDVAGSADSDLEIISTASVVQNHPGVVQLNTGPTTPASGDEASLGLQNTDAIILNDATQEHTYVAAIVRFPSVDNIEFNFGLFDAADAAGRGVNSVSVEFDDSADQEFNLVVVDGSSATAVATTTTVAADTWYLLELAAHEDEVQLWIDGEFAASTNSANIPDDEGLFPVFKVATETTGEKSVIIDAFQLRHKVDR